MIDFVPKAFSLNGLTKRTTAVEITVIVEQNPATLERISFIHFIILLSLVSSLQAVTKQYVDGKIEIYKRVGTGGVGSSYPCIIKFKKPPKLILWYRLNETGLEDQDFEIISANMPFWVPGISNLNQGFGYDYYGVATWSETQLSWYTSQLYVTGAEIIQGNVRGTEYTYFYFY